MFNQVGTLESIPEACVIVKAKWIEVASECAGDWEKSIEYIAGLGV